MMRGVNTVISFQWVLVSILSSTLVMGAWYFLLEPEEYGVLAILLVLWLVVHALLLHFLGAQIDTAKSDTDQADALPELFETHPLPMWIYAKKTLQFLAVNEAATQAYGYSREAFQQMRLTAIRPKTETRALLDHFDQGLPPTEVGDTWTHRTKEGKLKQVILYARAYPFKGKDARLVAVYDYTTEYTSRELHRKQHAFLQEVLDHIPQPVWVVDSDLHLLYGNPLFQQQMKPFFPERLPEGSPVLWPDMDPAVRTRYEKHYALAKSGETVTFYDPGPPTHEREGQWVSLTPVHYPSGRLQYIVCAASQEWLSIQVPHS